MVIYHKNGVFFSPPFDYGITNKWPFSCVYDAILNFIAIFWTLICPNLVWIQNTHSTLPQFDKGTQVFASYKQQQIRRNTAKEIFFFRSVNTQPTQAYCRLIHIFTKKKKIFAIWAKELSLSVSYYRRTDGMSELVSEWVCV